MPQIIPILGYFSYRSIWIWGEELSWSNIFRSQNPHVLSIPLTCILLYSYARNFGWITSINIQIIDNNSKNWWYLVHFSDFCFSCDMILCKGCTEALNRSRLTLLFPHHPFSWKPGFPLLLKSVNQLTVPVLEEDDN